MSIQREANVMIAFGQDVPEHSAVPKGSRWRNKRTGRLAIVIASNATHVLHCFDPQGRSERLKAVLWLDRYKREPLAETSP